MKIKVGKYLITSDVHQFILYEQRLTKKGDKLIWTNPRYYPRLEQVLRALHESELKRSDAESITDLILALRHTQAELLVSMESLHEQRTD